MGFSYHKQCRFFVLFYKNLINCHDFRYRIMKGRSAGKSFCWTLTTSLLWRDGGVCWKVNRWWTSSSAHANEILWEVSQLDWNSRSNCFKIELSQFCVMKTFVIFYCVDESLRCVLHTTAERHLWMPGPGGETSLKSAPQYLPCYIKLFFKYVEIMNFI